MAKTVVALFDHLGDAEAAVRGLEQKGFERGNISIVHGGSRTCWTVSRGAGTAADGGYGTPEPRSAVATDDSDQADQAADAAAGAGTGAVAGALAGLLAVTIPGIGPALALGPLAAILGGAGVGAAAGGLVGGLTAAGVRQEQAYCYEEGVRRGGTLVAVTTEDEDDADAIAVLDRHHPVDLRTRGDEWRQAGWVPGPAAPVVGGMGDTPAARSYGAV